MRMMAQVVLFVALCGIGCIAQSQPSGAGNQGVKQPSSVTDRGVVPLAYPYAISTAPHFALFVEFPRADSIRRIALGDSNYFHAEADKADPHYAIVKQIRASGGKGKTPVETNMLVYMASGRVVNIMLKAGKLEEAAYSVDYTVPNPQPKNDPPAPPPVPKKAVEEGLRDQERSKLADKMIAEVKKTPKSQRGVVAGGLDLRFYSSKRVGTLALVSFDVENTSSAVIDLEGPEVNLVTVADKRKDRKKPPIKVEPIELALSVVSPKQLSPGARATCLVAFKPPVHDSDQHIVLSISNRAMADHPAQFRIE